MAQYRPLGDIGLAPDSDSNLFIHKRLLFLRNNIGNMEIFQHTYLREISIS